MNRPVARIGFGTHRSAPVGYRANTPAPPSLSDLGALSAQLRAQLGDALDALVGVGHLGSIEVRTHGGRSSSEPWDELRAVRAPRLAIAVVGPTGRSHFLIDEGGEALRRRAENSVREEPRHVRLPAFKEFLSELSRTFKGR